MTQRIEIFVCYAREDQLHLQDLETCLAVLQRKGLISIWHDGNISPGEKWEEVIHTHLNRVQIILLLITPDFIKSDFCYHVEMKRAMERAKDGEARVIPLLVRSTHWEGMPFSELQVLPSNGQFVTLWTDKDEAFLDITKGIEKIVKELRMQPATSELSLSKVAFLQIKLIDSRKEQLFSETELKRFQRSTLTQMDIEFLDNEGFSALSERNIEKAVLLWQQCFLNDTSHKKSIFLELIQEYLQILLPYHIREVKYYSEKAEESEKFEEEIDWLKLLLILIQKDGDVLQKVQIAGLSSNDVSQKIQIAELNIKFRYLDKEIQVALANGDLPLAKIKIAYLREKAPQYKRLHGLERIFYSMEGEKLQLLIDEGKFSLVGHELNQLPDYTSKQATSGYLKEQLYLAVYQKAQHLIEENDFPQAQKLLEQLSIYYKGQKDVLSLWKEQLYLTLYQKAQHLIEENDFPQARKILEHLSIYYRDQEDVLRPCKERLHLEMYQKAQRLVEKNNFLQAKDILRLVGHNQPDYIDTAKLLKKIGVHEIKAKANKLEPSLFFLFIGLDSTTSLFIQPLPWLFAAIVLITIICYLFSAQCYEKKSLLFSIGNASITGLILTSELFYLLYSKEQIILLNKNQILYCAISTIIPLGIIAIFNYEVGCCIWGFLVQILIILAIGQFAPNSGWLSMVIGILICIANLIGIAIWFKCCVAAWNKQDGKPSHMLPYATIDA